MDGRRTEHGGRTDTRTVVLDDLIYVLDYLSILYSRLEGYSEVNLVRFILVGVSGSN